jgi:penicillin-binding protein 2
MAFGQGATVITPLQLADEYATLATGGTRYVPHVAAGVLNPADGKAIRTISAQVGGKVDYTPTNLSALLAGFSGVIQNGDGTAYGDFTGWDNAAFPLAGKTGTASTNNAVPTSLFVSFGPTTDPKYVIAVVIDQAGYGADAAAPVARQIWDYLDTNPIGPVLTPDYANPSGPVPPPTSVPPAAPAGTPTTTTAPGTPAGGPGGSPAPPGGPPPVVATTTTTEVAVTPSTAPAGQLRKRTGSTR